MNDQKKLWKYQRDTKDLEKQEMKLLGSLGTLCKGLRKDLKAPDLKDEQLTGEIKGRIQELKKKLKKAKMLFRDKMEQIEKMAEGLSHES